MRVRITKWPAIIVLVVLVNPSLSLGRESPCRILSDSDEQWSQLVREQKIFLKFVYGVAVCGEGNAQWPLFISEIMRIGEVRYYDLEVPFLYSHEFPANSKFKEFMVFDPEEYRFPFVCVQSSRCDHYFDDGFVLFGEEIQKAVFPSIVAAWNEVDLGEQVLQFSGSSQSQIYSLRTRLNAGEKKAVEGIGYWYFNNSVSGLRVSISSEGLAESPMEWQLDLKKQGKFLELFSANEIGEF